MQVIIPLEVTEIEQDSNTALLQQIAISQTRLAATPELQIEVPGDFLCLCCAPALITLAAYAVLVTQIITLSVAMEACR